MYNSSGREWISLDRHRIESVFGLEGQWKLKMEIFISFNRDMDLEHSLHLGFREEKSTLCYRRLRILPLPFSTHSSPDPHASPQKAVLSAWTSLTFSSTSPRYDSSCGYRSHPHTGLHQAMRIWTERVLLGVGITTIKVESSFHFTQFTHCSGVLSIFASLFLSRNPEIAAIIFLLQRRGLRHK